MICFVSASCVRLLHSAATANTKPTHVSPFHLNDIPMKLLSSAPRLHRSGGMSSYASFWYDDGVGDVLVENRNASGDEWKRSRTRRYWTKRKNLPSKSATFGIGKGLWRLHAPVAGTLPPRRGPARHPGAFPWREPSRASERTASGAHGNGAATRQVRAEFVTALRCHTSTPKNLPAFFVGTRHSSSSRARTGDDTGRGHGTSGGRHGRVRGPSGRTR